MMRSLSARVLALSLGLVLLTTLAAGFATVQFARQSARAEQRGELQAQASLVSLQSAKLVTRAALAKVSRQLDGTTVTVYDSGGALLASSAPGRARLLRAEADAVQQAVAGQEVSTSIEVRARTVLLEARPTSDGGAVVLTRPQRALTQNTGELVRSIGIVLIAGLLVAAAAAVWLSRRIARPLAATAAAARRLAHGERGVEVPEAGTREVGDVGDALRALDAALATSEGRQREFLLSISHEVRTPLTALQGYGEALADGLVTGPAVREVGATLVAETERIERFTADLLELARLEADDFSVVPGDVDLAAVSPEAVTAWRARAEAASVGIRRQGFDTPLVARADPRRVRQVLDGLIENALRATPAGGRVVLVAVRDAGAGIAVDDSGPGLSDDDLANAFTRGLLRERYRESRPVGTGLGLSIATRLAARMGGRIVAGHSPAPPGARFTLHLPTG